MSNIFGENGEKIVIPILMEFGAIFFDYSFSGKSFFFVPKVPKTGWANNCPLTAWELRTRASNLPKQETNSQITLVSIS